MPAHLDFLTGFNTALRGGPLPPGLIARDMVELDRSFAVYRNNVAVALTGALSARFPVIRRLVGEDFFAQFAALYAKAERPRTAVIAEWGAGFPAFLAAFPPLAAYPYLADVARIEFARGLSFHAADAAPVDPATLAAARPDRVTITLHPSVQLLRLSHPAVSIWARNQPDGAGLPIARGAETALILRDAAFNVPVRAIGAGDAALIEATLAGSSLLASAAEAQKAQPGHDPSALLVALMRAGAIIDARE